DANVTGGDAGQHSAGQTAFAQHVFAGGGDRKAARRRNAKRVHRFADEVFAQHRRECGATIAAARKRRGAGAFELDVETFAARRDLFADEDGAAVTERGEVSV